MIFLKNWVCDPKQFCGASIDILPIVEDVEETNIFFLQIQTEGGDFVGE